MKYFAAELPSITGATCATYLMAQDKPWWMWGAMLLFAFTTIVTNYSSTSVTK